MVGLGTLVNSGAILAGAGAGLLLRRGLPEKWQESIMQGVALCIIVIGVQMAFKSENIMVVIFSIVLGAIVGGRYRYRYEADKDWRLDRQ